VTIVAKKRTTPITVKIPKKAYSGFDDQHQDGRCRWQRWGYRLSLLADLESVALRSVGEHMTIQAFQDACMRSWNRAIRMVDESAHDEPGDPPAPTKGKPS